MNKDKELARLAGVVFEGCPDNYTHAAMDEGTTKGEWWLYACKPFIIGGGLWDRPRGIKEMRSKNQPSTDLPWKKTLICRSDYE